jgi:tetratricopeptide (TPR) repeat protein
MTPSPTLDSIQLRGSYAERIDEAHRLSRRGELEPAAAICRRIIDRIGRLPERRRLPGSDLHDALQSASILLAEVYAQQGDWPALDEQCLRGQAAYPKHAHRWAVEPFMLRIQYGRPQEGIDGLRTLAESNPESFYIWRLLAEKAWETENRDLALMASDHAAPLATPDEAPADMASYHIVRFELFEGSGEWQQAVHEWNLACGWDKEVEEMRGMVVRMFLGAGLYDDALQYLEKEALPVIVADYYRAWIAQQRGDVVRARHLWRKLAESGHDDYEPDSPALRAESHCWLGQPDAALAILLEAVGDQGAIYAGDALALGLAWALHGDGQTAESNIKLAIARSASSPKSDPLLPALDWIDFEQLVTDEAIKATLRPYFEPPRPPAP